MNSLPKKEYYTIGETANFCKLKAYVLRYWEQEFPDLDPIKRNKRRYYQQKDIDYILRLKDLLHEQGYSIQGAKALLEKENKEGTLVTNHSLSLGLAQENRQQLVDKIDENIQKLKKLSTKLNN